MCRRQPGIGMSFSYFIYMHCLLKRGIVSYWPVMRKVRWKVVRFNTTAQNKLLLTLFSHLLSIIVLYVIRT